MNEVRFGFPFLIATFASKSPTSRRIFRWQVECVHTYSAFCRPISVPVAVGEACGSVDLQAVFLT